MNKDLTKVLTTENSDKLFFLFKHQGAIDFEKKILAGKILNERGFDKETLKAEKELIVNSIRSKIKFYDNTDEVTKKNKRKINLNILYGAVYILVLLLIPLKDSILHNEAIDWIAISILSAILLSFVGYKFYTYPSKLQSLQRSDQNDKELLQYRLILIEKEWAF